jgi:hypothetical protein
MMLFEFKSSTLFLKAMKREREIRREREITY